MTTQLMRQPKPTEIIPASNYTAFMERATASLSFASPEVAIRLPLANLLDATITWKWEADGHTWLSEIRCAKSGGQLTTGDVAEMLRLPRLKRKGNVGDYETCSTPADTGIIKRVASDLAFVYIDRIGRTHLSFAYGDLAEIARRVAARRKVSSKQRAITRERTMDLMENGPGVCG
jgi:hypothetical protein